MSQTAITLAFEQWKASQAVTGEPVLLDEFVFANVPGLDATKPIDRSETLPPAAQIVHRQAVSRKGVVNENAVVHSVVLGAEVGDFSFNWIGLINKASNTLAMIVHAPLQQKLKTKDGQQGNVLTRSFLMEYNGAQVETGINTPAETWQIDFTARMAGMDERQRLENIDLYGAAAFLGNGYLVAKSSAQYFVTAGAGYVRGLRAQLAANQNITVTTTPVKVWLDVAWTGTLTSAWGVASKITVAATLADYVQNGVQHYVFAVASIDANGNITDLRPKGTLNDQAASDALKKHEQSRNHPDATTAAKGFTQLSSALDSVSETLAATPKAVKAANDNANGRVPSGRKINGRALTGDINVTAQDIFNGQTVGIGDAADLNTFTTPGLYYQPANAQAASGKNYPEPNAGSLEVYKHAGITQIYRVYNNSRHYIRTLYSGVWTAWSWVYDTTHKPTAGDVGALPITGGTVTGNTVVNGTLSVGNGRRFEISSQNSSTVNGSLLLWGNADRPTVLEFKDASGYHFYSQRNKDGSVSFSFNGVSSFAGGVTSSGEFISRSANGFRIAYGNYGAFWRNDGGSLYLLLTNSGDSLGTFNSLRPFTVSLGTGDITINKLTLANYASFDARYYTKTQSDNGYMAKTGAYTKAESDGRFQPKGSYTPAGQAYTKAESDGRFQPKGSYTPAGQAYTKAESNARYLQDFRLGARNYQLMARGKMFEISGNVITGLQIEGQVDGDGDYIVMRPLQKQVNGTWYTVAQS
ncbi:phage tail-collar fiber domain-containing protein [Enterobacter cancerogenus]|uniref:phage tail-collar fiber domain-containing protein n=1 Tax=Enterobacter cancerogenus TaxID=69218 RepID=UPI001FD20D13|nr:phage tail protein [Enterobacter cancerogenus]